jgi:hypothetical protein
MLVGMTFQSLIFNIFGTLGGNFNLTQNLSGNLVHSSSAAIGGILTGFLIEKFLSNGKNLKLKLHRFKISPEPARKREDKVKSIKPRKIGSQPEE